jgi:DNA-binding ferritin-like protein (Dps family)
MKNTDKVIRRRPKTYNKSDYEKLLRYCWCTTNLDYNVEKFLKSISDLTVLSENQFQALHQIAVECVDASSYCTVLRDIKYESKQPEQQN